MKKILFVDDETRALDDLQRMLEPHQSDWDMAFAPGGYAALSMLEAAPFDVVVSDMQMPGIDGAALLHIVREKYPNALRIILSGHTELEASFRAVPAAHQFLLKPCDPGQLSAAIERTTSLIEILHSKMLTSMVGSLRTLPSLPSTYAELREVLSEPNSSLDQVVRIVERDVAICAKVLQLVNSAFFGLRGEIADIKTAVSYLGMNILQHLVLSVEAFSCFKVDKSIEGFSMDQFYSHSQATARIAGAISTKPIPSSAAVVAGLLHDVGKLVIAERAPDHLARAIEGAKWDRMPLYISEEELCGVSHAEVGAYLLSLWGLPYPVVEAVAYHHHPERVQHNKLDLTSVVYLANVLAHEHFDNLPEGSALVESRIDPAILAVPDIVDRLVEWHELADRMAHKMEEARHC